MAQVINYCFARSEMNTIPTPAAKAVYAAGFFAAPYQGSGVAWMEPYPELIGETVIFAEQGALAQLTEEEQKGILLHEEGHIVLGHLNQISSGVLVNNAAEMEADRYAVEHGADPAAMISGVAKVLEILTDRLTATGRLRRFRRWAILFLCNHNRDHRKRIKALQAMV